MNPNLVMLVISLSCGLLTLLALLRFMMQLSGANFYNKMVRFVCNASDIYCAPLRSLLSKSKLFYNSRFDAASLIMAFLLEFLGFYLISTLEYVELPGMPIVASWSALIVIGLILRIYFFCLLLMVIFSWVRPQGSEALAEVSQQLVAPLLVPFHKFIPPMGGLDFSPMALFFLIYLLQALWQSFSIGMRVPLNIVFGV